MTDLSPAAQAVLAGYYMTGGKSLAAALRTVADQVVTSPGRYPLSGYMLGARKARRKVREELLAIAAELEAQ